MVTAQSMRRWSWVLGLWWLVGSCSQSAREQGRTAALMSGTPFVSDGTGTTAPMLLLVHGDADCSGFLISNQWAMTARHCISSGLAARPESIKVDMDGTRSQPTQSTTVAEVIVSPPGWDLALLRLATPFTVNSMPYGYQLRSYPSYSEFLAQVTCYSWGHTNPSGPPPDLPTMVTATLVTLSPPLVGLGSTAIGQGDAGGPCVAPAAGNSFLLAGVIVGQDGIGNGITIDMTRTEINAWVEAVLTAHDSNINVNAASVPAAASPDGQEIDLFWVDAGGSMNQSTLLPNGPTSVSLGLQADDPFAPVRPGAAYLYDGLHVIGRTVSGRVLELVSSPGVPGAWTPISSLPAIDSGIGLAALADFRMDLFARATSKTIVHLLWDGAWSSASDDLGGTSDTDVLGTWQDLADLGTSVHAFAVVNGQVLHKWQNLGETQWWPHVTAVNGWAANDVVGTINSAASITWAGGYTFDMFGRGFNGHLVHKGYSGGWQNGFLDLGLAVPGETTPVVSGAQIHIFSRNSDGSIWHAHLPR